MRLGESALVAPVLDVIQVMWLDTAPCDAGGCVA